MRAILSRSIIAALILLSAMNTAYAGHGQRAQISERRALAIALGFCKTFGVKLGIVAETSYPYCPQLSPSPESR